MADSFEPKFADLVRNYSSTNGTGDLVLGKAVAGFKSFTDVLQPGDSFYYSIAGVDKATETEVGRGTLLPGGRISRQPAGGAATAFTGGLKSVALVASAEWYASIDDRSGDGDKGDISIAGGVWSLDANAPNIANKTQHVASRAALAAASTAVPAAFLRERGREGAFVFDGSNLSARVAADTAQGVYIAPASDTSGASGAWVRADADIINVRWFGIGRDEVTADDYTGLLRYLASLAAPVKLRFPPRRYLISSLVNLDLPEGSVVDAWGALFEGTHDGVMFDLNPAATATIPRTTDADTVTKRAIRWEGGSFMNSNSSKTASVAIQAYFMRGFYLVGARYGSKSLGKGFYAFVKFGAKDTYHFIDCYSYDCVRHYWIPPEGQLFTASLTGNDIIDVEFRGCHMSVDGDEAGIYFENRVADFKLHGGSINGNATVAHARFSDSSAYAARGLSFHSTHFEQMGAGRPAVLFTTVAGGTQRYYGISFENVGFISGTPGWIGIQLAGADGAYFGSVEMRDGSIGEPAAGIMVDSNSRRVTLSEQVRFFAFRTVKTITAAANNGAGLIRVTAAGHGLVSGGQIHIQGVTGATQANGVWFVTVIDANTFDLIGSAYSTAYVSGGTMTPYNAVAIETDGVRDYVTVLPEIHNAGGSSYLRTPTVLTNWNTTAKSTIAGSLPMATEYPDFAEFLLPPKGYFFNINVEATASLAATANSCFLRLYSSAGGSLGGVRASCVGLPNDHVVSGSGFVPAGGKGDVSYSVNATGAGTLKARIEVAAVRQ